MTSVALTSDPDDDGRDGDDSTYAIGDTVKATVTFSADMTVTGTPLLTLDVGGTARTASYSAADSTATQLVFAYTVVENDADADGIAIAANRLVLNGGTIKAGDGGRRPVPCRAGGPVGPQGGRRQAGLRLGRDLDRRHEDHRHLQRDPQQRGPGSIPVESADHNAHSGDRQRLDRRAESRYRRAARMDSDCVFVLFRGRGQRRQRQRPQPQ